MPFIDTMGALGANLATETEIPNWTVASGFRGDSFHVISVSTQS